MTEKKAIFITGAASGIGKATADFFSKKGWFTGLFDINEKELSSMGKSIGEDLCCYQEMDVSDDGSVKRAVEIFSSHTRGKMHALFNCAGILRMGGHETISLTDQIRTINVNVNGVLNCIHESLDLLKKTPHAHIINMSSGSALYGMPELAAYSASKFALRGLTEALNIEYEKKGIQVCDIMALYVKTPMILEAGTTATSVQRLGVQTTPEAVAKVVWQAAHGNKVHWHVGMLMKALWFLNRISPFSNRGIVKIVSGI